MSCGLIKVGPGVVGTPAKRDGCATGVTGVKGGGENGGGAYRIEFPEVDEPVPDPESTLGSEAIFVKVGVACWSTGGPNGGL